MVTQTVSYVSHCCDQNTSQKLQRGGAYSGTTVHNGREGMAAGATRSLTGGACYETCSAYLRESGSKDTEMKFASLKSLKPHVHHIGSYIQKSPCPLQTVPQTGDRVFKYKSFGKDV